MTSHTRDCRTPRPAERWLSRPDSGAGGRCVCCGAPLDGPVRRVWGLGWVAAACGCGPTGMDPQPVEVPDPAVDVGALEAAQRAADRRAWQRWLDDRDDLRAEQAAEARGEDAPQRWYSR